MREFMAITKALSDANRVRILLALRRHELCVCQITELFGLATSTVSKVSGRYNHLGAGRAGWQAGRHETQILRPD